MYDVHIYKTRADFDNRTPTVTLDVVLKSDALKEGRLWLPDHEVVKVQSRDREFIEILRQPPKNRNF